MTVRGDASSVEKLEGRVDDILKQLDEVIKLHAAPGAPESDDADATGSGKDNLGGMQRRPLKHDQQVKNVGKRAKAVDDVEGDELAKMIEDMEKDLAKAKAKAGGKSKDAEEDEEDDMYDFGKRADGGDGVADETLTLSGHTIKKSVVGEAQFAIFKGFQDQLEKSAVEIQKHKDEAEMATLRKRADDDFPFVPGTTEERALMLKSIKSLPKDVAKAFEQVLFTSNKLAKSAFDRVGVHAGEIDGIQKNATSFTTKISEIKKRDNCSHTDALQKARKEDPEGFKAYQTQV